MIPRIVCIALALGVLSAQAGSSVGDKPTGFRFFNNHLTIKPYVSLSYSYDSNVNGLREDEDDQAFMVSPGADFTWRGDRWSIVGSLWYSYNYYAEGNDQLEDHNVGESLNYQWATSDQATRGWSLSIGERYTYISQADELTSGGKGIWRDRESVNVSGVVERRFTDRWHADLSGQYDWLDYLNNGDDYAPLYGWSEVSVGLEAGFAASKWTDFLVSGGWSSYDQKNSESLSRDYSDNSQSWTLMAGIGTRATEKIQYRALVGWSWFEYGGHSDTDDGWTYQLSGNWRITRCLQFSALGSSYYQPSERSYGSAIKVYSLSGGFSYLTFGDKVTLTANLAWRFEDNVYFDDYLTSQDYDEDVLSVRLGANYTINRWVSVYANFTYEQEWSEGDNDYDYERFRGTLGVRFHY